MPLIHYLYCFEPVQTVTVPIIENFNNQEFSTKHLELVLSNASVTIVRATLRVKSALFGLRYLMRHWFFTTAFVIISSIAMSMFLTMVVFLVVLKQNLKYVLIKMYPQKFKPTSSIKQSASSAATNPMMALRKKLDLS